MAGNPCSSLSLFLGILLILGIIISFVWLSVKSNLLRDTINDPVAFLQMAMRNPKYFRVVKTDKQKIPRPFSLARTQLAVWTLVIGSTYVYLIFCKHCGQSIYWDAQSLAILGISVGTTAAGGLIDNAQNDLARHQNQPSKNFFYDILSDENGISISRFQQLMWTLIAVILYLSKIPGLQPGYLPTLDSALLTLSGLSSAAYLTLKVGENNSGYSTKPNANSLLDGGLSVIGALPLPQSELTLGEQKQPN